MDQALIIFLVTLWAVVLLPSALRARRRSTMNSVDGFGKAMDVLKPRSHRQVLSVKQAPGLGAPAPVVAEPSVAAMPGRPAGVKAQRRRNLLRLAGASSFCLLLGVVFGGGFWALWMLSAAGLGSYAAWLRNVHVQRLEADEIVSELADLREARELARLASEVPTARAVGD